MMPNFLARVFGRKTRKVNETSEQTGHSISPQILGSSQPAEDKNQATENTVIQNTALASEDAAQPDKEQTTENTIPQNTAPASEDVTQAGHPQDWIGIVRLDSFFQSRHPSERVARAQELLQDSTKNLEATLRKYASRSQAFPTVDDESVKKALADARSNPSKSGEVFGKFIENILKDQEKQKETVTSKISSCLAKMYPVATFALGLVSFGADLAMNEHTRSQSIQEQLEKLSDHQQFLNRWREMNPDSLEDSILEKAIKLLAAITDFLRTSIIYLQDPAIKNFGKGIATGDAPTDKNLLEARSEFDQAVVQETGLVIMRWRQEEETQKALSWLSSSDFAKKQDDLRQLRLDGTGKWMLDDESYQHWLDGDFPTLWCPGAPGAGKTFITSIVVDDIQRKIDNNELNVSTAGVGIAFVYCDINAQSEQTTCTLLANITRQLVEQKPALLRLVKDNRDKQNPKLNSATLTNCTDLLTSIVHELDRTVVVVDALDECAELDDKRCLNRESFVKALLGLSFQLFITSRNLESIRSLLDHATRVDIRSRYEDIKLYVDWRIRNSPLLIANIDNKEANRKMVADTIIKKSSDRLNLARLQMDYIQSRHSMGLVEEALDTLPTTENDFYDKSIQRIKDKSRDADWAVRILSWIYFAKRPLKIRELQHALAVRPGKFLAAELGKYEPPEQGLVDDCEGLVLINRQSETMTLAHPTIRDYLNSAGPGIFKDDPEVEIARTCLTYLSYDVFSEGPCTHDIHFSARLGKYPLLEYAAHHWGDHARGEPELKLHESILTFFLKGLNLLSSVQAGDGTKHLQDWYWDRERLKNVGGLWVAVRFGLASIVSILLQQNEDIETKYHNDQRVLHVAAQRGYEAVVQVLLDHNADITAKTSTGYTALHQAVESGHKAVVSLLLERGAAVDGQTKSGRETPLWLAARSGNEELARVLLDAGGDIHTKAISGYSVLWIAARCGKDKMVQLLLEWGADVHATDNHGNSALAIAAYYEHDVVVQLLLETGPEWTALHGAAWHGQDEQVQSLLEKGANGDAKDQRGWTALHWASWNGHETVVRMLLQKEVGIDEVTDSGRTALSMAAQKGHVSAVRLLLQHGANVSIQDKEGTIALHMAATYGHLAVVQTLLDKEPHTDVKDEWGNTPLQRAARDGHELVVRLLLDRGADINARNNNGDIALHHSVESRHVATTQLLLERGADVHAEDKIGWTALFQAVNCHNEPAAQLLLEYGADPMNAEVVRLMEQEAESVPRRSDNKDPDFSFPGVLTWSLLPAGPFGRLHDFFGEPELGNKLVIDYCLDAKFFDPRYKMSKDASMLVFADAKDVHWEKGYPEWFAHFSFVSIFECKTYRQPCVGNTNGLKGDQNEHWSSSMPRPIDHSPNTKLQIKKQLEAEDNAMALNSLLSRTHTRSTLPVIAAAFNPLHILVKSKKWWMRASMFSFIAVRGGGEIL
ncbi:uncharacterized protein PAC_09378 [Phialocephala subalpina]|uniref:Uncharacterized protein n=1 Tax=Phialocephala subalpina TaxID=576137 RepID=A0A1L7X3A7_9HELO|nr:uncharacterized protein PAC_09378 [Phialocephala subalpina]